MPDFSRWGANGGDPSLNAIARTDRYLDALASEQPVYATDPADAELADLMSGWRDDVRRPPANVATQRDAEIVLHRAVAARRRSRMSMAVAGSVAAALLCLGGFGALVYGAGPGDALYGLRTALFGEQQVTRDDQVALAAQTEMQQVQRLIDEGNWTEAQDKLQTITSTVQTVEDPQRQEELQQQLNQLSVKVENRDPNATVPAAPIEPVAPVVPSVQLPDLPGVPVPPDLPFPPDISLPGLPGPGVPPDISLPQIPVPQIPVPQIPVPKPPVDLPKPDEPKPDVPKPDEPKPPKLPVDLPKPDVPKPDVPKPDEPKPPKQIAPDAPALKPAPAPAPEVPPAPVIGPAPVIPPAPVLVPKVPPALAPPAEQLPVEDTTTTWPPIPAEKPKHGD